MLIVTLTRACHMATKASLVNQATSDALIARLIDTNEQSERTLVYRAPQKSPNRLSLFSPTLFSVVPLEW